MTTWIEQRVDALEARLADLGKQVRGLAATELMLAGAGSPAGVVNAVQGTHYWDITNQVEYVNISIVGAPPEGTLWGLLGGSAPPPPTPHAILSATHTGTLAAAIVRGDLLYGNATSLLARLAHPGVAGRMLTTDATDVLWSTWSLTGTAGGTTNLAVTNGKTLTLTSAGDYNLTIPKTGTVPVGTGTAGRIAEWVTDYNTLQASTLVKTGAGVLTLSASAAYTLTVPATGTAAVGAGTAEHVAFWSGTNTVTGAATFAYRTAGGPNLLLTAANPTHTPLAIRAAVAQTANLLELQDSGAAVLAAVSAGNDWGIGIAPDSRFRIYSSKTTNDATTQSYSSLYNIMTAAPSANSAGNYLGATFDARLSGANNLTSSTGGLRGFTSILRHLGSGTITRAQGAFSMYSSTGGGAVTSVRHFEAFGQALTSGTISAMHGFYAGNMGMAGGTAGYGLYVAAQSGATVNYAIYTNAGLIRLGDQLSVVGSSDCQQIIVTGHTTQAVATPVAQVTRNDAAAGVSAMLGLTALGSGANGDGGALYLRGKSSTTAAQEMARIEYLWNDATHASRKADLVLSAYDTAQREGLRIRGAGAAAAVGLYGVAPVARATTAGAAAAFVQNSGNAINDASTIGGYTLLQVVKALQDIGVLT